MRPLGRVLSPLPHKVLLLLAHPSPESLLPYPKPRLTLRGVAPTPLLVREEARVEVPSSRRRDRAVALRSRWEGGRPRAEPRGLLLMPSTIPSLPVAEGGVLVVHRREVAPGAGHRGVVGGVGAGRTEGRVEGWWTVHAAAEEREGRGVGAELNWGEEGGGRGRRRGGEGSRRGRRREGA